jgi:ribosomal protein S18 acetylase RimI-like enzyme
MLKIRPARIDDAKALMHVHREAVFSKATNHYSYNELEEWAPGATPDRVTLVEQEISDPAFVVLVAETDAAIIGFAMAIPSQAELRAVYVKPNSIGGVGRALLSELEYHAFKTVEYLACDASLNAAHFYKEHGYSEEGKVEHALRAGGAVTCVRMRKYRSPRLERFSSDAKK